MFNAIQSIPPGLKGCEIAGYDVLLKIRSTLPQKMMQKEQRFLVSIQLKTECENCRSSAAPIPLLGAAGALLAAEALHPPWSLVDGANLVVKNSFTTLRIQWIEILIVRIEPLCH